MRPTLFLATALVSGALGTARAEDKATVVRTTSTVEVIDDARQIDDIIARVKARGAEAQAPKEHKPLEPEKLERAPLPPVRDRDEKAHAKSNRQLDRRDRPTLHRPHR